VLGCLFVMVNLPVETWLRFVLWMLLGSVIYFLYGREHSRLRPPVPAGQDRRVTS
jgi:APA family basic amino acid/polyamine antiporter